MKLGAKKSIGKNAYHVALYSYKIEDCIDADTSKWPEVKYKNVDVKNVGIEFDWTRNQSENLSYHLGLTYSHPEKRDNKRIVTGRPLPRNRIHGTIIMGGSDSMRA